MRNSLPAIRELGAGQDGARLIELFSLKKSRNRKELPSKLWAWEASPANKALGDDTSPGSSSSASCRQLSCPSSLGKVLWTNGRDTIGCQAVEHLGTHPLHRQP